MAKAKKFDEGKLRFDLIPPEVEKSLAEVLTFGSNKYGDRNWEQGLDTDRLLAAARRHLNQRQLGEIKDPESGLDHLKHALTNLAMWITFVERNNE